MLSSKEIGILHKEKAYGDMVLKVQLFAKTVPQSSL